MENVQITIVNNEESFKGYEIEKWISEVMKDNEHDEFEIAWELNREYYNKDFNQYTPNRNVYYYVEYFKDYRGFKEARLIRDYDKSPRKY